MGLGKKSTFGNNTSQVFTYDHENYYLMIFEYFWSSLYIKYSHIKMCHPNFKYRISFLSRSHHILIKQ